MDKFVPKRKDHLDLDPSASKLIYKHLNIMLMAY